MNKVLKQIGNWILAIIVTVLIMNVVLAFYNRTAGWIDRSTGATRAILNPGASIVFGTEGRGYHTVDKRGYVNNVDELADNYVIAIGASHSQGKEVGTNERYYDLLNSWLGYEDEAYVYCVSQDANYFPSIVKGFSALVQEFPDSSKIIIETGKTTFTVKELEKALDQREFDAKETGENIWNTLSFKRKLQIYLKEYSPLLFNVNSKISEIQKINKDDTASTAKEGDSLEDYEEALKKTFDLMTSVYDGEIIILYHPNVVIEEDGSLTIEETDTDSVFMNVCDSYGVTVVNMADKFISEYENDYTLPYGFSNSKPGSGHLNSDGHRMIAEELMSVVGPEEN